MRIVKLFALAGLLLVLSAIPPRAYAHCDGLDGPVVKAAQKALAGGNINFVLVWIQAKDEAEVRSAFSKTLAVRKLNPEARELADTYFFETLVRLHRAGEGEPYTGLKPAGRDLGPAIPAADKAVEEGKVEPLVKLLAAASEAGLRERFKALQSTGPFDGQDVAAGRERVKAYVEFVTYAEQLYGAAHGHGGPHSGM